MPSFSNFPQILTSEGESLYASGRSRTAFTMLKIAVFAPMPSARVSTATIVKPGEFTSIRSPCRKSCQNICMARPLKSAGLKADLLPNGVLVSLFVACVYQPVGGGAIPELSACGKRLSRNRTGSASTSEGVFHGTFGLLRRLCIKRSAYGEG